MTLILVWAGILPQAATPPEPLPIAQIRVADFGWLHTDPAPDSPQTLRIRPGEVWLVYEYRAEWGRTAQGWIPLSIGQREAARVDYSARHPGALGLELGVAALFGEHALLYGADSAQWVPLSRLELSPPSEDLRAYVVRDAVVRRAEAPLYLLPNANAAWQSGVLMLGQPVDVLGTADDDWRLVRAADYVGWVLADTLQIARAPLGEGILNAGPVNLRLVPQGAITGSVGFSERVFLLGQTPAGDWLYIRRVNGAEGWLAAQFITDIPADLPELVPGNE
ncbi:MAG: SH3 domain-containing protein [Anaerolineales bacterium]